MSNENVAVSRRRQQRCCSYLNKIKLQLYKEIENVLVTYSWASQTGERISPQNSRKPLFPLSKKSFILKTLRPFRELYLYTFFKI
jgi:hypothetical protein